MSTPHNRAPGVTRVVDHPIVAHRLGHLRDERTARLAEWEDLSLALEDQNAPQTA